jgi:hypothetical protein
MKRIALTSIAACCTLLATGAANALQFNIADAGGSAFGYSLNGGTYTGSNRGGAFNITPMGGDGAWPSSVPPGSFISYCVQIPQTFSGYGTLSGYVIKPFTVDGDYAAVPPNHAISTAQLGRIGQLLAFASSTSGFNATLSGMSTAQKTAVQAGIWEIVYEPVPNGTFNLSTGMFEVTTSLSSQMNQVQNWFDSGFVQGVSTYQNYAVLYSRNSQDFLVPVPEPEGYALAIAGMAMVVALGRRRQHRA